MEEEGEEEGLDGQACGHAPEEIAPGARGKPQGREDQGQAQHREVGELEPEAEEGLGAEEELEEEGEPQGLDHPGPPKAQEEAEEGQARHEARPHQGGARPGEEEVKGEEGEGQEVAPPPQGVEAEDGEAHEHPHVKARERQEVGEARPLEEGVGRL